jgi:hypothetical protein
MRLIQIATHANTLRTIRISTKVNWQILLGFNYDWLFSEFHFYPTLPSPTTSVDPLPLANAARLRASAAASWTALLSVDGGLIGFDFSGPENRRAMNPIGHLANAANWKQS